MGLRDGLHRLSLRSASGSKWRQHRFFQDAPVQSSPRAHACSRKESLARSISRLARTSKTPAAQSAISMFGTTRDDGRSNASEGWEALADCSGLRASYSALLGNEVVKGRWSIMLRVRNEFS
jgi:hypothetical protein